jgi:hypothetical protein
MRHSPTSSGSRPANSTCRPASPRVETRARRLALHVDAELERDAERKRHSDAQRAPLARHGITTRVIAGRAERTDDAATPRGVAVLCQRTRLGEHAVRMLLREQPARGDDERGAGGDKTPSDERGKTTSNRVMQDDVMQRWYPLELVTGRGVCVDDLRRQGGWTATHSGRKTCRKLSNTAKITR